MVETLVEKRIDYKTAVDRGVIPDDEGTRVEFRAIEKAILAMDMIPAFKTEFEEHGIELDEILHGVFDLDTLFSAVTINCGQDMVDAGHLKNWGKSIMRIAENGYGTNGDGKVNRKLRDFVLSDKHHFGIEIEEK